MATVTVNLHSGYDVKIDANLLSRAAEITADLFSPRLTALVTDANVDKLFGDSVEKNFADAGFLVRKKIFAAGENSKSLANYGDLLQFFADQQLTKSDLIIALGGGVIGDLAGFAAATYLRGVNFIQIPTTLLAMVDSSVGGKTAVNLPNGKNLVGAFYQPKLVIADIATLTTLPPEMVADGMAEIIKYGVLQDAGLFAQLAKAPVEKNAETIAEIVAKSVAIKRDYVVADERDEGARQFLNFGHTFGHAIEKISEFKISHGHAVAIGMNLIALGAAKNNFCSPAVAEQISAVCRRHNLPTACPFDAEKLVAAALNDKKRRGGKITLVIPRAIGKCELLTIAIDELADFL